MKDLLKLTSLAICFGGFLLTSSYVFPSGSNLANEFIVKGAGTKTCEDFTVLDASRNLRLGLYAGWVEGYLTAYNAFHADTYDITPFQSTKYLLILLEKHCKKNPNMSFLKSVRLMVHSLYPRRVQTRSPVLQINSTTHATSIYESILTEAKIHLRSVGYSMTNGLNFSHKDAKEVFRFQSTNGLEPTGVLDESTLSHLFFRN